MKDRTKTELVREDEKVDVIRDPLMPYTLVHFRVASDALKIAATYESGELNGNTITTEIVQFGW